MTDPNEIARLLLQIDRREDAPNVDPGDEADFSEWVSIIVDDPSPDLIHAVADRIRALRAAETEINLEGIA